MGDEIDLLFKTAMDEDINENNSKNVLGEYSSPEDREIAEIADSLRVRIKIIGCGGGGSNTINRMSRIGIDGADLVAINTDAAHLLTIKSKGKLLIGKRRTGGRGTGASPVVGEEAAMEDLPRIQNMVAKNDITFVTCGLGGGTGTGSAPIIAKCAKDAGSLVISVVTLPFSAEGSIRMENALRGLEKVSQYSDTVIAIPNDKLLKEVPKRPIEEAFGYADSVLSEAIKGITELITKTGIINLDYADIKTIMKDGGVAMIGIGTSNGGQDRVLQAVNDAIKSPLVEADISEARNCLIRVIGGPNMTVSEAETAMSEIQKKIDQDARIIWGANVNENMGDEIKVLVLITGVKSPYMISGKTQARNLGKMFSPYSSEEGLEMVS
jgi:cell division protein FtsZ